MISKKEAIKFLIEDCYKKFPELIEKIPEEEMYRILKRNIFVIQCGGKSNTAAGLYRSKSKKIQLLNYGKLDLSDIKSDEYLTAILAHEGIHALFRKGDNGTGIHKISNQINIKGFLKKRKLRYTTSKTFSDHIRKLKEIMDDLVFIDHFGRALNEGLTEWTKTKCTSGHQTYLMEVNIVKQLENILGIKGILNMVDNKPKEIAKILNMKNSEFTDFCNQMDYI